MTDGGYTGPATLLLADREVRVDVNLRGHFQPIDGHYHWYGRFAASDELDELVAGRKRTAVLRTEGGEATGEVSDPDPWRRYRITGISTPPFRIDTELPAD
ncbi:MAG TPA: DUF4873 domain-containing protein [Pseudonocardiaceae bacterium]|jgi:hypothetical protein